jgi:hypothetical protein
MIGNINDDPPDAEKEDPFLEAELDRAMESYKTLLPPEMFTFFRETLSDTLTTHPVAARLLSRARPRHIEQTSETRETVTGKRVEPAQKPETKTGGGKRS